jgi:hypothetical protein
MTNLSTRIRIDNTALIRNQNNYHENVDGRLEQEDAGVWDAQDQGVRVVRQTSRSVRSWCGINEVAIPYIKIKKNIKYLNNNSAGKPQMSS